jgi:hypothetical protein
MMMKKITFLLFFISSLHGFSQDIFQAKGGSISFFSKTPLQDIDAVNNDVKALLKTDDGSVAFVVTNIGFRFKKPLMEEHFNENYMESDKYKVSMFKGKIVESIDYTKNGTYIVSVKGVLNIHGVEKERTINGEMVILDEAVNIKSKFEIQVKEHKIKIPKLLIKNIAETVQTSVDLDFELKK